MCRLHDNSEYSDLVIECQGSIYNVHKAIVCTRSEFFAAACRWPAADTGQTKKRRVVAPKNVSDPAAVAPRVVDLNDDDPVAVWAMVQYLYYLEYPTPTEELKQVILKNGSKAALPVPKGDGADGPSKPPDKNPNQTWGCMLRHAQIYTLADKYSILGLKHYSAEKFGETINGEYHGLWPDLVACVREVYTATPDHDRKLRDQLRTAIRKNMRIAEVDDGKKLLIEIPQLAVDVLLDYHAQHKPKPKPR